MRIKHFISTLLAIILFMVLILYSAVPTTAQTIAPPETISTIMDIPAVQVTINVMAKGGAILPTVGSNGNFVYMLMGNTYNLDVYKGNKLYSYGAVAIERSGNPIPYLVTAIPEKKAFMIYYITGEPMGAAKTYGPDSIIAKFLKVVIPNAVKSKGSVPDGSIEL